MAAGTSAAIASAIIGGIAAAGSLAGAAGKAGSEAAARDKAERENIRRRKYSPWLKMQETALPQTSAGADMAAGTAGAIKSLGDKSLWSGLAKQGGDPELQAYLEALKQGGGVADTMQPLQASIGNPLV